MADRLRGGRSGGERKLVCLLGGDLAGTAARQMSA